MSAEEKKTLKMINFKCHIDICGEPYLLAVGLGELKVNNYVEFREGNYRYFKDISCIFCNFFHIICLNQNKMSDMCQGKLCKKDVLSILMNQPQIILTT